MRQRTGKKRGYKNKNASSVEQIQKHFLLSYTGMASPTHEYLHTTVHREPEQQSTHMGNAIGWNKLVSTCQPSGRPRSPSFCALSNMVECLDLKKHLGEGGMGSEQSLPHDHKSSNSLQKAKTTSVIRRAAIGHLGDLLPTCLKLPAMKKSYVWQRKHKVVSPVLKGQQGSAKGCHSRPDL